jgi:hypothetical protein
VPARLPAATTTPSRRWTRAWPAAAFAAALLVSAGGETLAQTKDPPSIPHGKSQLKGQAKDKDKAAAQPQAKIPIPPPEQMAMLIQTAVVALSQANLTGNFTVLHALGAPGFQQSNPPAKLAEVFKNLREQNVDLTPVILFSPILLREPVINAQGMLHLVGHYKTAPQQVNFEVLFQPVAGQWRLFGISVRTVPAPTASAQPPAGSPPAAASTTDPSKKTK